MSLKATVTVFSICVILSVCMAGRSLAEKSYRIISVQHQSMAPYETALKGFEEGLKFKNYLKKTKITRYNAENNLTALDAKVLELKNSRDFDLIFALGTQATKRLVDEIKTTPIVFTGLGDPENSGVIPKNEKGEPRWDSSGANYTGVETPAHISLGIRMMSQLIKFEKIGMIYLAGSPSHEAAIKQVEELSRELGCRFFHEGFPLRDEKNKKYPDAVIRKNISDSLEKILPQVDVFFVQASKTFDDNFDIFRQAFLKHKTLSAGDPLYIRKGIIMGIGKDFKEFGKQCAKYAFEIFEGKKPSELQMNVGTKIFIELNLMASSLVGYDPAVDLIGAADKVYEEIDTTK